MTKTTTITINGRLYDAITGMPLQAPKSTETKRESARSPVRAFSDIGPRQNASRPATKRPEPPVVAPEVVRAAAAAQAVHHRPQKSATLYRKALKKPEVAEPQPASLHTSQLTQRSPLISKFANITQHPQLSPQKPLVPAEEEMPRPPELHPAVASALQKMAPAAQPAQLSSKQLKEQLIKERLAEVDEPQPHRGRWFSRKPRLASVLTSSLALLVLGGYITYMNLPIISMKVAASRAGVSATMPSYNPDGYSLNGPITYAPGEVTLNYKANTSDVAFKITQKPSSWDSQAVLDNYVNKYSETPLTFQERGITVYTFNNQAAWVNGGLLYTLEGTASLSSDQVLRLATSM